LKDSKVLDSRVHVIQLPKLVRTIAKMAPEKKV